MYKFLNRKLNRGYAMIESMVAITILMIVVLAPLTLAYSVEKKSRIAAVRSQATYLANEGVELMIFYRKSLETYCINFPSHEECGLGGPATSSFQMFLARVPCVDGSPDYAECRFDASSFTPGNTSNSAAEAGIFNNTKCDGRDIFVRKDGGYPEYLCSSLNAEGTQFSRYVVIERVNVTRDRSGVLQEYPGVKIISTVCYDNGACNEKVQVINYVYQ